MWLQPPFFSIDVPHLGHALVFATSQLNVSESSLHLTSHFFRSAHVVGEWSSWPHWKQKRVPHLHPTPTVPGRARTARPQSAPGHHLMPALSSTKERLRLEALWKRCTRSQWLLSASSDPTSADDSSSLHFSSGQRA